jgi:hypothetical protein
MNVEHRARQEGRGHGWEQELAHACSSVTWPDRKLCRVGTSAGIRTTPRNAVEEYLFGHTCSDDRAGRLARCGGERDARNRCAARDAPAAQEAVGGRCLPAMSGVRGMSTWPRWRLSRSPV